MKRVVSVSLGSSRRDHAVRTRLLGEEFSIERRGTDGDKNRAVELIRQLDGHVDAIGLGGIDLYVVAGRRRYVIRDALQLARAATRTPVVDGTGLKNTLERRVIRQLEDEGIIKFKGKKVLMVAGVDRFGMAEALDELGAQIVFGDLMFALGLPLPLMSLGSLERAARIIGPIACRLPISMLYPTGKKQDQAPKKRRFARYYHDADIIAGDFHFIRSHMPDSLRGKIIITNTITGDDISDLRDRGASLLVTTTPEMEGRSFGTNVMEGVLLAILQKRADELTVDDYEQLLDRLDFSPRVVDLS